MRNLFIMALAMLGIAITSCKEDSLEKRIIGKWCNPYTYQSTGELKGYEFKEGGKCSSINIPSWELETWKIDKEGYLIIEGFEVEDGKRDTFRTRERIALLNADSLELVVQEESPRMVFLYINTNSIDKLVKANLKDE